MIDPVSSSEKLDKLGKGKKGNVKHLRRLFDLVSVSIWEVDLHLAREFLIDYLVRKRIADPKTGLTGSYFMLENFTKSMKINYVNKCTLPLYNAENIQVLQENFASIFREDSMPFLLEFTAALVNGDESFIGEGVNYSLDGRRIPVLVTISFHDGDLDYHNVVYTITDLSEINEANELIKKSEERLQTVLHAIPDSIFLITKEGNYLDYYKCGSRENSLNAMKLTGLNIKDVFKPEKAEILLEKIKNCIVSGNPANINYELEDKNGIRYFESRIVKAGKNDVLTLDRDVTASKMAETELRKAKNMAEASSKIKSALLRNMSHEFKTPMNGILNYAKILDEQLKEKSQKEMAVSILNSGNRLMASLDAIMYLAEIESSSVSMDIKMLELSEEIKAVIDYFEDAAHSKGLNFQFNTEDTAYAYLDKILLIEVFKYLMDNAVKFTASGLISVYVRKREIDSKSYAELEIKDTGIGISEENQKLIFSEFYQESMGYGRSHEGFGLGLTLSKKMVELMNGRIYLESQVSKGSSFFVRFPFADTKQENIVNEEVNEVEVLSALVDEAPKTFISSKPDVLVVEDNLVNMELATMFLKDICKTDRAKDGLTAIKLAEAKKYDAILMDINLGPGINGLEAAQEIRKIKGYKHTPIVAVTGYTMSGDREKMLKGGCSHYLPKPFDKKGIIKMVKDVLKIND